MTHVTLKKWTTLFILFAFLANQCSPLYAVNPRQTAHLNSNVANSVQAAQQSNPAYWVERGAALAEANCDAGTMKCVLDLLKSASWEKDPAKATVCVPTSKHDTKNKVCMKASYFAQGAVHAAVSNPQNPWLYYDHKEKTVLGSDKVYNAKVDPFPVRETAPDVFELIAQWGVYYDSDMQALNKYFKGVAYPSTCGKKKNTCHEEMIALLGLAFLATQQDGTAKKDARKTIAKILNKKWDSDDGGLVIKGAIIALGVLNTQAAWRDIDTFVTDTSLPNVLFDALGSLTVEGIADLGILFNSQGYANSTRYYNNSNKQFSYLDTSAARKQGFNYPYNNPAFQYPNNNVFEEIGYFIGREAATGNKSAQKLAKKIMRSAIAYARHKTTPQRPPKQRIVTTGGAAPGIPPPDTRRFEIYGGHWPVVVGIMDGATSANKPWSVTPSRDGVMHLIQHVFAKGFWDLNAGTYMRVFNITVAYGDSLTKKGTFPRMSSKSKGYLNAKERYKKITTIKVLSEYADMAIFAVSAFLSFASLSEALTSIFETGRWIKDQVSSVKEIARYSRKAVSKASRTTIRTATVTATTTLRSATQTTARGVRRSGTATAATATATTTGTRTQENYKELRKSTAAKTKKTRKR